MNERVATELDDSRELIAHQARELLVTNPEAPALAAAHESTQIEIADSDISIDATLLGELLSITPAEVPELMRNQAITGFCERGIDADEGEFRLSFFHRNRRARVTIDAAGRIIHRSVIDFGEHPLPRAFHRGGGD